MVTFTTKDPRKRPKKATRKKKDTKRDVCRRFGVPEHVQTGSLRYQNPIQKGIYWYFMSLFIRQRDVEKWGTCISCNRPITVETSQGGHFIPAATCGRDLLFDERNVNAECSHCNAWDEMHLIGYARNLDIRYGAGTADALIKRYEDYKERRKTEVFKDWSKQIYEVKILEINNHHPQETLSQQGQ